MMEKSEKIEGSSFLNKLNSKHLFVMVAFMFTAALMVALSSSKAPMEKVVDNMLLQQKKFGQQPITKGCVNIYGSDWHIDPKTAVIVICSTASLDLSDLKHYDLDQSAPNHGISFIETGADATVTLYDSDEGKGLSLVIKPLQTVWLNFSPYGKDSSWNDRTKSVTVTSGAFGRVQGLQKNTADYCVTLYATDPHVSPHTYALVACGKEGQTSYFTQAVIASYPGGLKTLKDYSLGTSYVTTGAKTTITLFDGIDCYKDYDNKLTIGPGENVDLLKVELSGPDQTRTWNDVALSFVLQN
jgi:hypothetical protein